MLLIRNNPPPGLVISLRGQQLGATHNKVVQSWPGRGMLTSGKHGILDLNPQVAPGPEVFAKVLLDQKESDSACVYPRDPTRQATYRDLGFSCRSALIAVRISTRN